MILEQDRVLQLRLFRFLKVGGVEEEGLRPGQNSTADVEQIVDIPARGGLQDFLPGLIESIV